MEREVEAGVKTVKCETLISKRCVCKITPFSLGSVTEAAVVQLAALLFAFVIACIFTEDQSTYKPRLTSIYYHLHHITKSFTKWM